MEEKSNYHKVETRLYEYRLDKAQLLTIREEIEDLEDSRYNTSAPATDDIQVANTNVTSDPTANSVLSTTEKIQYREQRIDYLEDRINMTERGLGVLTHREREVIEHRYMDGREWVDVAAIIEISVSQCQRARDTAIRKMEMCIYPKIYENS